MQLVVGGAYSGKRKIVKQRHDQCSWISSYNGHQIDEWQKRWKEGSTLVIEGFENWLVDASLCKSHETRNQFQTLFQLLLEEEKKRGDHVVLIMLEVGRGIVPMKKEERQLRDLLGWVAQDAASIADEVEYVWNGLSKKMK